MGIMQRFESNVERAINGVFAKAFRASVQPIELTSGIRREADAKAVVVGRGRTLVPNAYTFVLAPADYERFADWQETLAEELTTSLTEHARSQRYSFSGPILVRFQCEDRLDTGIFHIVSSQQRATKRTKPSTGSIPAPHVAQNLTVEVNGHQHPVTSQKMVVGRGSDADIVVHDTGVSRHHAEIGVEKGAIVVRDLGSTNGTFVNDTRVTAVRVHPGDVITLGRTRITVTNPSEQSSY